MRNIMDRYNRFGTLISSPYFQRYETPYTGLRVPFGAYIEFLPSSRIAAEATSKMAPKTIPGIFIGYYENVRGMTQDYIVI